MHRQIAREAPGTRQAVLKTLVEKRLVRKERRAAVNKCLARRDDGQFSASDTWMCSCTKQSVLKTLVEK